MRLPPTGQEPVKCDFLECEKPATDLAADRTTPENEIGRYCEAHAHQVAERGSPEYVVGCPNCCCLFGWN